MFLDALTLLSFGEQGWGDDLLLGFMVTIALAVTSMAIALILGALLAWGKIAAWRPVAWLVDGYLIFIRGVPEFLILLLVFFGSERILNQFLGLLSIDSYVEVPRFAAGVAALSLIFAAYSCEVLRGAYQAVPVGQIEAGDALGLSSWQVFFRVRLPQLWRYAIEGLGNLWMVVLKDTSLVAVLAIEDLLRIAKVAGETSKQPLLFFLAAGVLYLALTAVSDYLRRRAELAAQPHNLAAK